MTIETKLHVRDHAMWSQLDQAITRVAGAVDENETPFDSDDEALEFSGTGAGCWAVFLFEQLFSALQIG